MTRVCLVGEGDVNLQYELLSRETSREALAAYDLTEPYANTIAVETVSLGAAVSLLNDLEWYLVRFTADAIVEEPSVSETEWLSRGLATAVRDGVVDPEATGRFLRVYGVATPETDEEGRADTRGPTESGPSAADATEATVTAAGPPELRDPMLVTRTGETIPAYDLHDVSETLVVRVTESEFGA
ncbi:MAG: DUF5804 family protein [Halovenus sp.]